MFLKHLVAAAALASSFAFGSAMAQTPPALPSTSFNVVGSIGGLVHANIEASWLLVPMIRGIRANSPWRAASTGCLGNRSVPNVSP